MKINSRENQRVPPVLRIKSDEMISAPVVVAKNIRNAAAHKAKDKAKAKAKDKN